MERVDGRNRGVADPAPAFALGVLGRRAQEREILVEDVLDAEEDVAEAGAAHERRERGAVARDRRGHRLDDVVDVVQAGVDDRAAQCFEARDVERDVVVDEKDGARAAAACASAMSASTRVKSKVWKFRPRISMIEQKLQS